MRKFKYWFYDRLEIVYLFIEKIIYEPEDRQGAMIDKIEELEGKVEDLKEVIEEYEYREYFEEMRYSTRR